MSVDWGICWPCVFIPACSLPCPPSTACSCSTRVNHTAHYTAAVTQIKNIVLYDNNTTILSDCVVMRYRLLVQLIFRMNFRHLTLSLSLYLCGRPINMPLCMGFPLGGRRRAAEHGPSHAERRPTVVWAQSCWSGMVDTQHQHSEENGGEGTRTNSDKIDSF